MLTRADKERIAQREQERETRHERIGAQAKHSLAPAAEVVGRFGGGRFGGAVPKPEPLRSLALRAMAKNRPCMFLIPGICNARLDTTVLCHENQGKGMGTKQSDARACWGCSACHQWYDTSGAPREQKRCAFMAAHARQVLAYRVVATDPDEPPGYRAAALLALGVLGATPLPDGLAEKGLL